MVRVTFSSPAAYPPPAGAIASAVAAMFLAGGAMAKDKASKKTSSAVKCAGINECKGQNECKGKGFEETKSAKECADKGGEVLAAK
jgi:hypothetical protein